jgi:hypothetical protein
MIKKISFSFLLFVIASLYITYPLIFHMGEFATGVGDELVIAWTQNWVNHVLFSNPLALFDANLYYPYQDALAFSDLHFVSSVLALLPFMIVGQPISVVNFNFIC